MSDVDYKVLNYKSFQVQGVIERSLMGRVAKLNWVNLVTLIKTHRRSWSEYMLILKVKPIHIEDIMGWAI